MCWKCKSCFQTCPWMAEGGGFWDRVEREGGTACQATLPSHPLWVTPSPPCPKAKFARLGIPANLRQRSREGSNINFKPARAKGSGH